MLTVFLHGKLGRLFGKEYKLEVASPAEAVRALECLNPGKFYTAIADMNIEIVRGETFDIAESLTFESDADIHFTPEIEGSGGIGQFILGAVIIIAAVVAAAATAGGSLAAGAAVLSAGTAGTGLFGVALSTYAMLGATMMIGGVASMLAPVPKMGGAYGSTAADKNESFVFTGAVNRVGQGGCVPVVYGAEVKVGSVFISQSLMVEDV